MIFVKVLKLLFPLSKAFRFIENSLLNAFIKGLASLPEDVKAETERVFLDLFPETTRAMTEWEKQFSVLFANEQYGETRRGILEALWRANTGGQTAQYLQALLQKINNKILVFENTPVKNPRDANAVMAAICGQKVMCCGAKEALCGFKRGDSDFVPGVIKNDKESLYDIPVDKKYWEQYFFVCGGVVRNSLGEIVYCQKIQIQKIWKEYIEYLILKIKPVQTGCILFIQWI